MSKESRERELRMDELDTVSGGGATIPLTQCARQTEAARKLASARQGVTDDSV